MIELNYIELPLKVFKQKFPQLYAMLPPIFDTNSDKYIVRIKNGHIQVCDKNSCSLDPPETACIH